MTTRFNFNATATYQEGVKSRRRRLLYAALIEWSKDHPEDYETAMKRILVLTSSVRWTKQRTK